MEVVSGCCCMIIVLATFLFLVVVLVVWVFGTSQEGRRAQGGSATALPAAPRAGQRRPVVQRDKGGWVLNALEQRKCPICLWPLGKIGMVACPSCGTGLHPGCWEGLRQARGKCPHCLSKIGGSRATRSSTDFVMH